MYVTFSLTCVLRTVYLINLKNLICVDIVKCQVKFCLLLDLLLRFLKNLASTGGPHVISRRAACGPRAAGWTALAYNVPANDIHLCRRSFHTGIEVVHKKLVQGVIRLQFSYNVIISSQSVCGQMDGPSPSPVCGAIINARSLAWPSG